jgi:gamma-glutamylcyclotransferase (GGCT)/AIG2-like uncharacterized protein YtfP
MSPQNIYNLFVYGSLRSGFRSEAYQYISSFFNYAGAGRVRGKMYDMGSYPAAIPTETDHFIQGELFVARDPAEFAWAIGQLDDYEGVSVEADEVQLYRRELTEVFMEDKVVPAWIYWFNGETAGREFLESGDVFDYLKKK